MLVYDGAKFEDSDANQLSQSIFIRCQRCLLSATYMADGVASFELEVSSLSRCPEL